LFCPHCGTRLIAGAKFCSGCGTAVAAVTADAAVEVQKSPSSPRTRLNPAVLALAGLVVGGLLGFQMRPAVMFIGQLPFETVMTRGAGLTGIDQIMRSTAQQSFNVLLVGALAGGFVGFGVAYLANNRR
jgi:hypothetical protein